MIFDLLHLDGASLLALAYDHRRAALEPLDLGGAQLGADPLVHRRHGRRVLRTAVEVGMEGVVAKRRASTYQPGQRSRDWIKVKSQHMQEVVIGGYTRETGVGASRLRCAPAWAAIGRAPNTDVRGQGRDRLLRGRPGATCSLISRRLDRATSPFDAGLPPRWSAGHLGDTQAGGRGPLQRVDSGRPPPPSGVAGAPSRQVGREVAP